MGLEDEGQAVDPRPTATEAGRRVPTISEVNIIIEQAVRVTIDDFQRAHPMTCRVLRDRLGHPLQLEIISLVRDAVYSHLKAETEKAVDIGQLAKAVAVFALKVVGRFLPLI